jgi:chromate transporter
MSGAAQASQAPDLRPPQGPADLFLGFLKLGATAFGGTGPMTRHLVVDDRRWMDDKDFAGLLGLCQALPGANTCNLAIMIGDRFAGPRGALAALAGLLAAPLVILVALASLAGALAQHPLATAAMTGAGAAAAGLVIGAALRLLRALGADWVSLCIAALTFAVVGIGRAPLAIALVVLAPAAIALSVWRDRRA